MSSGYDCRKMENQMCRVQIQKHYACIYLFGSINDSVFINTLPFKKKCFLLFTFSDVFNMQIKLILKNVLFNLNQLRYVFKFNSVSLL